MSRFSNKDVYDSSDTETESKHQKPKPNASKTIQINETSFKLNLGSDDETNTSRSKQNGGRVSRVGEHKTKTKSFYSDSDEEPTIVSKTDKKSGSRTPSTERYESKNSLAKKYESVPDKGRKVTHFSRPTSAHQNTSSDESTFNGKSKPKVNDQEFRGSDSRSRSSSPSFSENVNKRKNKKSEKNENSASSSSSSSKNSKNKNQKNVALKKSDFDSASDSNSNSNSKSKNSKKNDSSHSFDRPTSSKNSDYKKKKTILKTSSSDSKSSSSSSSRSRSRSDSSELSERRKAKVYASDDEEQSHASFSSGILPMKINIGRKPPIDKSNLNKKHSNRSPSLEKPYIDSNSDSESKTTATRVKSKSYEDDSQNSSNEMTDVSPLPSPRRQRTKENSRTSSSKDKDRIDTSKFYNALNNDFSNKMDSVLSTLNNGKIRPNFTTNHSSKKHNYSTNNLNTTIDFTNSSYGSKLLRLDAENRRLYEKLIIKSTEKDTDFDIKPVRVTSSALNRQREQQRIEKENQQILKRLLDVKPSKYLRKDDQLKDYERNFGFATLNYSKLATDSMTSMSTKRSTKSTANNSRISSAKSTAKSQFSLASLDPSEFLKRAGSVSRHRPEWNERW